MKLPKPSLEGAKQYYNELPAWSKGVVVVGGLLLAYFVGKKVINFVFQVLIKKGIKS